MARIRHIPHDQDREDQKAEEKAERRRAFREPANNVRLADPRFGFVDPEEDEFENVPAFLEWKMDNDEDTFNCHELQALNYRTQTPVGTLRKELESYGLTLVAPSTEKQVRGFTSNPHNRWAGNPCGGGSGGASIYGMCD